MAEDDGQYWFHHANAWQASFGEIRKWCQQQIAELAIAAHRGNHSDGIRLEILLDVVKLMDEEKERTEKAWRDTSHLTD